MLENSTKTFKTFVHFVPFVVKNSCATPALAGGARENKDFTDKVLRFFGDRAPKKWPLRGRQYEIRLPKVTQRSTKFCRC